MQNLPTRENPLHRREFQALLFSSVLLLFLAVVGCGGTTADEQTDGGSPAVSTTPTASEETSLASANISHSTTRTSSAPQTNETQSDSPEHLSKDTQSDSVELAFQPPFPNRTNPFARPSPKKAQSLVRRRPKQPRNEGGPELKGFVNVNGAGVLLMLEGQIWFAKEGERRGGILVETISPPVVTLSRGESKWDLSLHSQSETHSEL